MRKNITWIFSLLCALTLSAGITATAQNPYRVTERQVQQLLTQLESHTNDYRTSLNQMLGRSRFDTNAETDVKGFVREFDQATNQLLDRFRNRRSVSSDVEGVLTRGWQIDNFMRTNQLGAETERKWRLVRTDLQTLSGYYNVSWRWDERAYTPVGNPTGSGNGYRNSQRNGTGGRFGNRASQLTGTYRLNPARSDNVQQAANRATRGLTGQDTDRVRASLLRRLDAPEQIALEQQGQHITIASSSAPQAEIDADGREQTETRPGGRTVRTVASLKGNGLSINSTGDRGSDFNVTFQPIDNGRSLQVTKTIYTERLTQPVVVRSLYTRASDVAQWNIYDSNRTAPNNYDRYGGTANNNASGGRDNRFAIPNGTMLTATLNEDLTTRQTREGQRFTMTVRSPGEFNGAVIEGTVIKADRSGRVTGRSEMSLEFQRLQMKGRTYEFGGFIESVRTANGEEVKVNSEGTVKEDDSQTTRTVTRSGIGAALGAIIGGIAGGGSGAAIGAAVGAGAGAGTVLVQGRDDLDLARGTEFSIRASAPRANY
ncbi:MAG: hypothetical protein ABI977_02835 [Acidobacteriota bacterium]